MNSILKIMVRLGFVLCLPFMETLFRTPALGWSVTLTGLLLRILSFSNGASTDKMENEMETGGIIGVEGI